MVYFRWQPSTPLQNFIHLRQSAAEILLGFSIDFDSRPYVTYVTTVLHCDGKPQILGTRSLQTLKSIDLNLTRMITSAVWPYVPKMVQIGPAGSAEQIKKGWNIMFNWVTFSFFTFLAKLWRTHFWEYHRILCTVGRVSVGTNFLGGSQHSSFTFSPLNPPKTANFRPVFGLRKITPENA